MTKGKKKSGPSLDHSRLMGFENIVSEDGQDLCSDVGHLANKVSTEDIDRLGKVLNKIGDAEDTIQKD